MCGKPGFEARLAHSASQPFNFVPLFPADIGLAVGLTVAGVFLFIVFLICVCVCVICCVYYITRSSRRYPGVYRTTAAAAPTTTVYTAGVTQSTVPVYPVAGGYKPEDPPPPYAASQEMLGYPPPAEYPQQPAGYPQQQPPTGYDQPVDYAPPSYPPAPYPTQPYPSAEPYPM